MVPVPGDMAELATVVIVMPFAVALGAAAVVQAPVVAANAGWATSKMIISDRCTNTRKNEVVKAWGA